MNILHICISERYVEGDSYHENILPTKHQMMGNKVTIIASQYYLEGRTKTMRFRPIDDYINKDGIHVIIMPCYNGPKLVRMIGFSIIGLYKKLEEISPDVIFVHGVTVPDNKAIANYVKNHRGVKLFADNHNDYNVTPLKKGIKAWVSRCISARNARLLLPYAQKFWGTIPLRVNFLQHVYHIPAKKTDVLIMGGDESLILNRNIDEIRNNIRRQYGIPQNAFLVVTGGAFDKRKQQYLLMEAVKRLSGRNVWLLAFGEPVKSMESVFEGYKNIENIVMAGWLPSDKAYDMFLSSDLAFFPGWHSVLWEQAVACGIPLVVKSWKGVDHVDYNGNAILMDDVNVDSIEQIILSFLDNEFYCKKKHLALEAAPNFYMSNIANKAIGL